MKIAFPGALPVMLEGIQMGQAIALLTIVAAEMMGATSGIGYLIWTSYKAFMLKEMFVGLILISFFGFCFRCSYVECKKKLSRGGEKMERTVKISIHNLTKIFIKNIIVSLRLKIYTLKLEEGEFVCIVGPSGCGKSNITTNLGRVRETKFW